MKQFISLLLVLLMMLSLAACGSENNNVIVLDGPVGSSDNDDEKKDSPAVKPDSDANNDPEPVPEYVPPADDVPVPDDGTDAPVEEDEPVLAETVTVYFSDDSGVNFISYPAALASTDVTGVIGALKDYGVLDGGVKANSFTTVKNDGKTYIKLELNSAFTDQITAAGDSYGYMLLGSVVNTLLDAYEAVGVQVTVGGRAIDLGGVTYSGYLTAFGTNPIPPAPEEETEPEIETPTDDNPVVATALSLLGAPYKYGGEGPDAFDNSGFVYYCFKANGITIPRRTSSMFLEGIAVNKSDLKKGDVVFFSFDESATNPTYVAIYIGDGKAIAESNENNPVSVFSITTSYYTKNYVGAKRFV